MILNYLIGLFVFVFGVCIGSFLNCYIYRRLPASAEGYGDAKEEIKSLKGRSYCPHCKHELSWKDLFPVFSFLFLQGKCRYCHKKISIQYPIVEIATGLIFLLIFNFQFLIFNQISISNLLNLTFLFYVASVLIIIFVYDLKHYIIPDKVLVPAIVITLIFNFQFLIFNKFSIFISSISAAIIASAFFLAIFLLSKGKAMGFGDVKLAVLMGLLLGFSNVITALFLAFFFGAIIGLILMFFGKKKLKSEIPFGPFLITGTFIALFWGEQLVNLYIKFFNY